MGQQEILDEIIKNGEMAQVDISKKFKLHGPLNKQLDSLRLKNLIDRKIVGRRYVYFPTDEGMACDRA